MSLVTPDFGLLIWQLIVFVIVLFLLGKFAWKPILTSLKERENTIEDALRAADKAKEEMQKLQAANEKLLQEARVERDRILKEAHAGASSIMAEAKDKANVEGTRLIENARQTIKTEEQAALTKVRNLAAEVSVQIAEKLLRKELSSNGAQEELVNEYMKDANLN